MAFQNAMEIFALLDKSNCRKCGEKTCLAFSGAVYTGRKKVHECPILIDEYINVSTRKGSVAAGQDSALDENGLDQLKTQLADLDFKEAAQRCGGRVEGNILKLKILGKDFGVDATGAFYTNIHVITWVTMPFLLYVLHGAGKSVSGDWISLREMKGGRERYALFQKRTEDDLCAVADTYPDFFSDIVQMFDGSEVESRFASDISVVLYPLPKVPIMICYWKPEDGIGSSLNLYFDATADDNIGIDGIYSLGTGLVNMLNKLALQHGFTVN
ncbi:DUF3786 domain-containing protein [Desulfopila sp. IMCC35008]|uniref:DUF3786 domain-containing protein n=1 Tax=Desulfopila sp. IMCC35008 TaxID=2653858 RepID=UPI001F0FA08A|nr:DUF3786 domain-containing protein [Desulfopila sp. IMCC35008]